MHTVECEATVLIATASKVDRLVDSRGASFDTRTIWSAD